MGVGCSIRKIQLYMYYDIVHEEFKCNCFRFVSLCSTILVSTFRYNVLRVTMNQLFNVFVCVFSCHPCSSGVGNTYSASTTQPDTFLPSATTLRSASIQTQNTKPPNTLPTKCGGRLRCNSSFFEAVVVAIRVAVVGWWMVVVVVVVVD